MLLLPPTLMASFSGSLKSGAIATALAGSWVFAQATTDPLTVSPIIDRAIKDGGLFLLVVGLLFFYRRDTLWATEFWKGKADEYAKIINDNTASNRDVSNAVAQSTMVMHQTKRVLENLAPSRRTEDRI
jgi:hypothetical protein